MADLTHEAGELARVVAQQQREAEALVRYRRDAEAALEAERDAARAARVEADRAVARGSAALDDERQRLEQAAADVRASAERERAAWAAEKAAWARQAEEAAAARAHAERHLVAQLTAELAVEVAALSAEAIDLRRALAAAKEDAALVREAHARLTGGTRDA